MLELYLQMLGNISNTVVIIYLNVISQNIHKWSSEMILKVSKVGNQK